MTGAGVSAGIDLALTLAAKIAGPEVAQTIQLAIEYDPQPPFDAGSPSKAPKPIYDMAVAALRARSSSPQCRRARRILRSGCWLLGRPAIRPISDDPRSPSG